MALRAGMLASPELSMNRNLLTLLILVLFACLPVCAVGADEPASASPASALDDAARTKVDQKAQRIVDAAKITDPDQAARVKAIAGEWLVTMMAWHKEHDGELNTLWAEWNKVRSVVPKDEFPAEIVATKIESVYSSLKSAYEDYLKKLSAAGLSAEQIDAIKEFWSRSPGMMRTYTAYLEIVPDLSDKDKEVIKNLMLMAREAAMLTDDDKEIVAIYKRHKIKVEQYVGALEWSKLHKAFANRGKAKADENKKSDRAKAPAPAGN